MTDIFTQRALAFENMFGHELEVEYKIRVRADLYFGLWAAEQLQINDQDQISDYTRNLIVTGTAQSKKVIDTVLADLKKANLTYDHQDLLHVYTKFHTRARQDLMKE